MDFANKDQRFSEHYVGPWRENPHDDLVLAVALACWFGEHMPQLTDLELAKRISGYF